MTVPTARLRHAAFPIFLLMVSGCLGSEPTESPTPTSGSVKTAAASGVAAPVLVPGTAWTFRGDGMYDCAPEFTVVVRAGNSTGPFFAGRASEDLPQEIIWGPLHFVGQHDRDLNRIDGARLRDEDRMLSFPLFDGKTWSRGEGLQVRAAAAQVATPTGTEAGFRMTMTSAGGGVARWDYAPSVGYIVNHEILNSQGVRTRHIYLHAIGTAETGRWYEPGPMADTSAGAVTTFQVPAGWDAVVVSAGARNGGAVVFQGPTQDAAWTFKQDGGELWRDRLLPASPGTWSISTSQPPPDGFAYGAARPVRWSQVA